MYDSSVFGLKYKQSNQPWTGQRHTHRDHWTMAYRWNKWKCVHICILDLGLASRLLEHSKFFLSTSVFSYFLLEEEIQEVLSAPKTWSIPFDARLLKVAVVEWDMRLFFFFSFVYCSVQLCSSLPLPTQATTICTVFPTPESESIRSLLQFIASAFDFERFLLN